MELKEKKYYCQSNLSGKILSLVYVLTMIDSIHAQNIFPLGSCLDNDVKALYYDSSTSQLFAGGSFDSTFDNSLSLSRIGMWDGNSWSPLDSGVNDAGHIKSLEFYGGELIAGGNFRIIGGQLSPGLAKWNGNNWQPFANATTSSGFGGVQCLFVDGSDLYVGGIFDSINGIYAEGIAKYDGINWYTFPPFSGSYYNVTSILFYNNELYIGGNFEAGPGKNDILKFNGNTWESVGGGFSGNFSWVNDMIIYQGNLYVAGYFQIANGDPGNNIAMWNGVGWNQPDDGLMPGNVFDLHIFDNKLYAGGQILDASGLPVSRIAIWDGFSWDDLDGNILNNSVLKFASSSAELFIGGGFYLVNNDTIPFIAKYENSSGLNDFSNQCKLKQKYDYRNKTITLSTDCQIIQSLKVYDIYGRIVKNKIRISKYEYLLDIKDFSNGVYIIEVNFTNQKPQRIKSIISF